MGVRRRPASRRHRHRREGEERRRRLGLEIKYPEWGRYLLVAEDKAGGHRAARTLYIDWPGWAGRGQKEQGGGATVLAFAPDKPEYADPAHAPEPNLQETRYAFKATPEMAPNIYAHVTLLQPHAQTQNDLPIRLYGVAPIKVVNPTTRLQPVQFEWEEEPQLRTVRLVSKSAQVGDPVRVTVAGVPA